MSPTGEVRGRVEEENPMTPTGELLTPLSALLDGLPDGGEGRGGPLRKIMGNILRGYSHPTSHQPADDKYRDDSFVP